LNTIADVDGVKVGQADDAKVWSGVTVILPDASATAAVDVRGGGPGTRETDALNAWNLVHAADAIVLSGGSVYGLAAADGVAAWLGSQGRGYQAVPAPGVPRSPIVPAAILFDLANGGDKDWGMDPPYRALGLRAVQAASRDIRLGTTGAGYGAFAGSLKGGMGSASWNTRDGITVGAIVAVNAFGSVVVPGTSHFWAGAYEVADEFGGRGAIAAHAHGDEWGAAKVDPSALANTTIACIATDVALDANELKRIAVMAQDGLARAIRPVHSPFDGDTVFAFSTAKNPLPAGDRNFHVMRIGSIAADALARAVARGVYAATLPPGMPGRTWRDL
jgi:L-aminopeptidase/D-esterase-like protein